MTREARPILTHALSEVEDGILAEIGALRSQLRGAGEAAAALSPSRPPRPGAAAEVLARASDSHEHYAATHQQLLCLIARQGPVAGDLRLAIALLHVNDRLARISSQCVNIATLCQQMPSRIALPAGQLECLAEMVRLADSELGEAARVLAGRDPNGVMRLLEQDQAINEHNRRCFSLAVQSRDRRIREAVFFVALMARAIERIGDNAVDIARQAAFVSTGELPVGPELAPRIEAQAPRHPGSPSVGDGSLLVESIKRVVTASLEHLTQLRARRRSPV